MISDESPSYHIEVLQDVFLMYIAWFDFDY